MMELDSGDVLEPVLFSPSVKSHIKYNSIIIMLLDHNNNTSHLCLILLLSILLLVLFYITLFMKTYQAAKLKMMSKKKVHHHIHHKSTSASGTTVYHRTGGGSSNGGYQKVATTNVSNVYQRSPGTSTNTGDYQKINSAPLVSNTINYQRTPNGVTTSSNGGPNYQKLNSNASTGSYRSNTTGGGNYQKSPNGWTVDSYKSTPRTTCPLPPKVKPVEEGREEMEEKGKIAKKPTTSVGAPGSRKASKDKHPSESLYDRKSSDPHDTTPSPPSSSDPSPSKPNRKRNPRISEPPPWSGDPPAWLRPAVQPPSNLTDVSNVTSRSDEVLQGAEPKLHQSEDEDDEDEACTTQSTASSISNASNESEAFITSSGVSSNVSFSSNSSDDGTGDPLARRSSENDYNKENRPDLTNLPDSPSRETRAKTNDAPVSGGNGNLTRRQKKNRVRRNLELNARIPINKLSRFYQRLAMKDAELHKYLSAYAMTQQQLINFSFPFESKFYANKAVIYSPGRYNPKTLDPKAREFVPSPGFNVSANKKLLKRQEVMWQPDVVDDNAEDAHEEKICARCNKSFFLSAGNRTVGQEGNYEYLTQEHCHYHWGKITKSWLNGVQNSIYSCCNEEQYKTLGCVYAKLHVWSGLKPGINGPLEGYVKTKPRKTPPPNGWGVYALDTEMVYTVHGLEVARVTVVNVDGRLIYNTLVKPDCEIVDYNTKYSGISARDYVKNPYKSLRDVQNDLMGFISRDSLIVGHGLENDMRALKIIHSNIIDTSILFPHVFGLPFRRSLKSIVSQLLHQSIQSGTHDSFEDARACVDLVLWKLINQLKFN